MDRTDKEHREEMLNIRSFYLRLLSKIWIIPLAAVIGALAALGIYTLVTVTFGPQKTYRSESRLYISFAYDEKKGTLVDWYNAYTWDNLLLPTDDILNPMIEELGKEGIVIVSDDGPAEDFGDEIVITRQELLDAITAEIPSDVRIMLLSTEYTDKDTSDAIMRAAVKSMEHYGRINDAFDSIKVLGTTEAKLVVYSDRSIVAAVFGALACVCVVILIMLMISALDDSIYVPEDAERRYDLPVLGVTFGKGSKGLFRNELIAACNKVFAGKTQIAVISVDSIKDDSKSAKDCEILVNSLGKDISDLGIKLNPLSVPGKVLDNYRKIGTSDGVILCVPYKKNCGTMAEHIIAQLHKHECPVLGIVLVRANEKFMNKYYRISK